MDEKELYIHCYIYTPLKENETEDSACNRLLSQLQHDGYDVNMFEFGCND